MPLGGRLTIGGRAEAVAAGNQRGLQSGDYICITVTDTGTGMDDVTLKRATEPFFTTKGVGKGTGLGLSMVHGFAAQSGGSARITSRLGTGTTIELWLPVAMQGAPAQPATANSKPALATAGQRSRILVVDDDPLVMASTAAMLEDLGHAVVQATSAIGALTLLRANTKVDLVITDHAMPGLTGTELARLIRQSWPSLPIILVTGYPEVPKGEDQGLPWLTKPYQREDLAVRIDAVLTGTADAVPTNVVAVEFPRRA